MLTLDLLITVSLKLQLWFVPKMLPKNFWKLLTAPENCICTINSRTSSQYMYQPNSISNHRTSAYSSSIAQNFLWIYTTASTFLVKIMAYLFVMTCRLFRPFFKNSRHFKFFYILSTISWKLTLFQFLFRFAFLDLIHLAPLFVIVFDFSVGYLKKISWNVWLPLKINQIVYRRG